ncbi:MAG TPA: hypothetical protein VJN96_26950 [Vicinamibacterales bacterium]|nr:hypothetical protein [Vicinamibacterales bacterium]
MDPTTAAAQSFKGTIFSVWKGNKPCRIYVGGRQVYFIRRVVGVDARAAVAIGSQFGMLGGLAVGLAGAAKAKSSPDYVRDDDPTPPEQLLTKCADNFAIPVSDIIDPRIEPKGKFVSYGKNDGQWYFKRPGDAKETVVLFDSPSDASYAVFLLSRALGGRLRNESGIAGRFAAMTPAGIVTNIPVPQEQADIVNAMQNLTQLLSERAPAGWQKVRCEVRAAAPGSPRPLEIVIDHDDQSVNGRPAVDSDIDQAAMRLARKLSTSVRSFPGVVIEMTRLEQGGWRNNMKLLDKR